MLFRVSTILAANIAGSSTTLDTSVYRLSAHNYLCKTLTVPAYASVLLLGRSDGGLNLEEGDAIYTRASALTSVALTISYDVLA